MHTNAGKTATTASMPGRKSKRRQPNEADSTIKKNKSRPATASRRKKAAATTTTSCGRKAQPATTGRQQH
jgi:hypothetical protein